MFCNGIRNIRFDNLKQNLYAIRLYYELPSNACYFSRLWNFLGLVYCICQYANAWFEYIHTYCLNFAMLLRQFHQKILPYCTSPSNRDYYNDVSYRICQYVFDRISLILKLLILAFSVWCMNYFRVFRSIY